MSKKALPCLALFLLIAGLHAAWISTRPAPACPEGACGSCEPEPVPVLAVQVPTSNPAPEASCGSCDTEPSKVGFSGYLKGQDYFLGLSYGLSGAFTLYALWIFLERRRAAAAAGAAGSLTLAGVVSGACCGGGCFLAGCCGSPTLPILASFLGGTFLSFIKPLAFGVTLVSLGFGFWWLSRGNKKSPPPCKCADDCCGT